MREIHEFELCLIAKSEVNKTSIQRPFSVLLIIYHPMPHK
jgi:hypothetical protein